MISVTIYRNRNDNICGFLARNHGRDIVCAAVSAVTLNTVNSIEALTDERFQCDHDDKGGYLSLSLPEIENGKENHDVDLLLRSLELALRGIESEYEKQIKIVEKRCSNA